MSDAWEAALPRALRSLGKPVVDSPSAETAWSVNSAQDLIQWLQAHKYAVLGGDYYTRKAKAFEPTYDNWHCELRRGEAWASYIDRSCTEALQSLKQATSQCWVVIVASSKPTMEQLVRRDQKAPR